MKQTILTLIVVLGFCLSLFSQYTSIKTPPNVILIVVDDMGRNDVSYHGSEVFTFLV